MPARSLTTESHRLHLRLSLSFLDSVSATMLSLDLMYDNSNPSISFVAEIPNFFNCIKDKFVLCHFLIDCCHNCGSTNGNFYKSTIQIFATRFKRKICSMSL